MIRRLLRLFFRSHAHGGTLPPCRPRPGEHLVTLSSGQRIVDPDDAEALGMSAATVERVRRQQVRPEGRFPPGFIDRINQGKRP